MLKLGLATLSAPILGSFSATDSRLFAHVLPRATYRKLPCWKGFNLLEKFMLPWNNRPFQEEDFRWISELGFNFVRLPMDYRCWIQDGNWTKFDEKTLRDIDQAVEFGEKYSVHVCINFHRAPGYTVANPGEPKDIWSDPEAQEVCALHWSTFAKRYRGISSDRISFNLFNEPPHVEMGKFLHVHRKIIGAIRAEDSERLIICDGMDYGSRPVLELAELEVAQSTRGYAPMEISHYGANWVNSEGFPTPQWPIHTINGLLLSEHKKEVDEKSRKPFLIEGPFPSKTRLRLRVGTVSSRTKMEVLFDGKTGFEHLFEPGPGTGEWKKVVFHPQWNVYQNVYDRDYFTEIPAGTREVRIRIAQGDWVALTGLGLQSENMPKETSVGTIAGWNQPSSSLRFSESDSVGSLRGGELRDRDWLKRTMIEPWTEAEKAGIGVMVGEFGPFNKTPHDVALRWLRDSLENWNQIGWGYALWNFRGSFGILDSERADVNYENFHGHQLDRKMLRLLQGEEGA